MKTILRYLGKLKWVRYGVRDRLIRRFYNPDKISSESFVVNFYGMKYRGSLSSYIDWSVYFFGAYEKETVEMYRELLKGEASPLFLDIGANVGHHSIFVSRFCERVHSFEPNPNVRISIEDKISENNLKNVTVHSVGLGKKNEELQFFAPVGSNAGTGSFVEGHSPENQNIGRLHVVNADEYIKSLELNSIHFVKIDVEGFEKSVLEGMRITLSKYSPIVVMEFSQTTKEHFASPEDLLGLLPDGYQVFTISTNRPRFSFFNSSKFRFEKFDFNNTDGDVLCVSTLMKESLMSMGIKFPE